MTIEQIEKSLNFLKTEGLDNISAIEDHYNIMRIIGENFELKIPKWNGFGIVPELILTIKKTVEIK